MSDVLQHLTGEESFIETGTVDEYLGKGKYRVIVRGRWLVIRSAVERLFGKGTCVVITRTGNLRYIIGTTGRFDIRTEGEVVIDA